MIAVVQERRIGVTVYETTTPRACAMARRELRVTGVPLAGGADTTSPSRRAGKRAGR
jgi:hypothetical protein